MEYKPSDTPTDAGAQSALETRLPAMLTRLADGMPASVGLADRVERQLTANTGAIPHTARWRWGGVFGAPAWRQRAISAVGLVVVVALIAGFAIVFRGRQVSARPTIQPSTTTISHATNCGPHGRVVRKGDICTLYGAKVSIAVQNTYADVTRTSVQLRITLDNAQMPFGSPTRYSRITGVSTSSVSLRYGDGPGQSLGKWDGSSSPNVDSSHTEIVTFGPLPPTFGASSSTVTLDINQLFVIDNQGHQAYIAGSWAVSTPLSVHMGRTIPFHVAPITHDGVTVRPLQLNVAPDVTAFDGYAGGDELIVQVSGLSLTMDIGDVIAFNTQVSEREPGGGRSSTGSNELTFEGREPALVTTAEYDPLSMSIPGREVGLSGTVTLEISFLGPLPSLTGTQPLDISQFGAASNDLSNGVGPWEFQLPLN